MIDQQDIEKNRMFKKPKNLKISPRSLCLLVLSYEIAQVSYQGMGIEINEKKGFLRYFCAPCRGVPQGK